MFSPPQPRPGIFEITPYVVGKSGTGHGQKVIKLSSNESPLGASPLALDAYRGVAERLHRYPDAGSRDLTEAIGRRFDLDPARIVCGAGSDELIALLIRAYAGPGDEVLISRHGYLMYKLSALAAGAHVVEAPERNLTTDVDAILACVTSRTRLVFIANPNNPTGSFISKAELTRLHAGLPAQVLLVIDAAYAEYAADVPDYDSGIGLVLRHPNVVVLRTFSKLFGLAALRIGWLFAPPAIVDVLHRIRGPFNVGAPAQAAAIAALADRAHQEAAKAHNDRWLPWLQREVPALGLKVWPSLGNFLLIEFAGEPGRDAKAAEAWLERQGVLSRDVVAYGLGHCLRVSVGTDSENQTLVQVLRDFVDAPTI